MEVIMEEKQEEMLQQLLLDLLHIAEVEQEKNKKEPLKPIMKQYTARIEAFLQDTKEYRVPCKNE